MIRFEGQAVLDVTVRVEGGGHRFLVADRAGPARSTLAVRLGQRTDAGAVLTATDAQLVERRAARLAALEHSRLGQVVDLAVVHHISNATVETLSVRLVRHAADLQRRVQFQLLIGRWYRGCIRNGFTIE